MLAQTTCSLRVIQATPAAKLSFDLFKGALLHCLCKKLRSMCACDGGGHPEVVLPGFESWKPGGCGD